MAKRKVIRKSNRPFTYNPHYYSWGGDFKAAMGGTGAFDLKSTFSGGNVAEMLKGGLAGGLGSAVGNIAGSAIGGGFKSGAGSAISNVGGALGGIVGTVSPLLGGIVSAGTGIIGGLTNRMFGSKLNKEKIAEVEGSNKAISTVMVDSSSADSVMNQWANQDFGADFSKSDIGKDGWFGNKAKKKYRELKKQQDIARDRALTSYENAADAVDTQSDLNAMANFAAFGGPLDIWGGYGSGAIGYELAKENLGIKALNAANKGKLTSLPNSFSSELNTFAEGGKIHIKPSKRGTFTAAAKKHGKSVQSFASQVLANKEDYSSAMVKKANFARNTSKWKHADGGPLKKGKYEDWYKTVPADRNDTTSYNLKRAYELAPYDELEAWRTSSIKDLEEGKNHLRSVYLNPNTGVYEFMKSKNHPTLHFETDWYNSNDPEAVKFRKDYDLDMSGDYYKYVPKKKAFGGDLLTHGAEWDNGLRVIGNGGTHEENPMEGVPMGIDAEGTPNLVEQGEVIFNDYVFSNRLFADGSLLESFNLPKSYDGYSFAAIAEKLGNESKERPNDPISKRGLLSSMSRLQQAQEMIRQSKNTGNKKSFGGGLKSLATSLFGSAFDNYRLAKGNLEFGMFGAPNPYAHGGRMGTLFDGLGQYPNYLLTIDDDSVPEGTMFDPISNRYVFTGYQDSDDNTLNFGSGITPSGEWLEEPKYMARAKAKRMGYNVGSSLKEYNENPIANSDYKESGKSSGLSNLRYAPVIGAAIGLGQNLFSKPDYKSANAILEAANQAGNYIPVGYTPIGNYLQYRPFDRNFYLNKLNAQAGATRRAIMNTTSPSRNAALLAADYNAQGRVGDLARQAEEYNLAQRQAVETFNRGTNQFNSEMGLKAAMANQEAALKARSSRLSGVAQAMAVRDAVDARRGASMSANLTNLFDSLGSIGKEEFIKDMIEKNPAILYDWMGKYKGKKSKGGYLTIKKRRK